MPNKGLFITFEGGDGAGKSTQVALLAEHLRTHGHTVRLVREPGGTALGEDIRRILKHAPYGAQIHARAEMLLFAASRAQLVNEVIRPALDGGEIVLCDRFTDSTLAYQGGGRGLPVDDIAAVNSFATGALAPDLTVLLDLPAAEGLARAQSRAPATAATDRMETLEADFYERVRAAYLAMAAREPARFFVADARLQPEQIAAQIRERIARLEHLFE